MITSELLALGIQIFCVISAFFITGIFYHKGTARKTMVLLTAASVSILLGLLVFKNLDFRQNQTHHPEANAS